MQTEVEHLNGCLDEEREKVKEISDQYSRENADTMEEIDKLSLAKQKLIADKFSLTAQVAILTRENEEILDEKLTINGDYNQAKLMLEECEEKV